MNTRTALVLSIVVLLLGCEKQQQKPEESVAVPLGAPRCVFRLIFDSLKVCLSDNQQLTKTQNGLGTTFPPP